MTVYVFTAEIQQMVAGLDDTATLAVNAGSLHEAAEKALEQDFGNSERYVFTDEVWSDVGIEQTPATSSVKYVGTLEQHLAAGGVAFLSEAEGEKVTEAMLADSRYD